MRYKKYKYMYITHFIEALVKSAEAKILKFSRIRKFSNGEDPVPEHFSIWRKQFCFDITYYISAKL